MAQRDRIHHATWEAPEGMYVSLVDWLNDRPQCWYWKHMMFVLAHFKPFGALCPLIPQNETVKPSLKSTP